MLPLNDEADWLTALRSRQDTTLNSSFMFRSTFHFEFKKRIHGITLPFPEMLSFTQVCIDKLFWRDSLFCCCTASMEQAETAAIDGLVSS